MQNQMNQKSLRCVEAPQTVASSEKQGGKLIHLHSRSRSEFVVLAPAGAAIPSAFQQVEFNTSRHHRLLASMQALRGRTYLDDGAIGKEDLTSDGRHQTPADEHSWHVLSTDANGEVTTCLRFIDERETKTFNKLWVNHTAMAHSPSTGWMLRKAVETRMAQARAAQIGFGSVGGWASAPSERRTMAPVSIILATFGLLELLGGCIGLATATMRHQSATILRKIGLTRLSWHETELPAYFDPQYGCEMEMLEFDSARVNPKYTQTVKHFMSTLCSAPVICRDAVGYEATGTNDLTAAA
jgi:hypothetical protein